MKTITKELNLLDIEDIEKAVSKSMNREVKIGEIDCTLTYCIPSDTNMPDIMLLDFEIESELLLPQDLFEENSEFDCYPNYYLDGKKLSLSEPWLPVEEIFSFDVSAFKSFEISHDLSPNEPGAGKIKNIIIRR